MVANELKHQKKRLSYIIFNSHHMSIIIKKILYKLYRPKGKDAFISMLPTQSRLMDIGCGNDSPRRVKSLRNDIYYVGLDVQSYQQSAISIALANEYRIVPECDFVSAIRAEVSTMDAILSSHNLEHCQDRDEVIFAMCAAIKQSGFLYLSYPSESTVRFPSRQGTLNYYDDKTHKGYPPETDRILKILQSSDMKIIFCKKKYRPTMPFLIGLFCEPFSYIFNRVAPFGATWALYGFETVIWAQKYHD